MDKQVLGGCREEVLLLVFTIGRLIGGNVGKGLKVVGWGRGDGGTGDNVGGGVRDVEEWEVLNVVKGRPDEFWQWGMRRGSNGRGGTEGIGIRTWVIPSVEV